MGLRSSVPSIRSDACDQRGWGNFGFTFAQKPYSLGASFSQKLFGRLSVNSMETMDLMLLKPYFHGVMSRMGAPCCWGRGLP